MVFCVSNDYSSNNPNKNRLIQSNPCRFIRVIYVLANLRIKGYSAIFFTCGFGNF